ncbi:hypothetical protein ACUWC2_28850, partial [Klebsiella pneumoniae]|uniref:hypothetical protein n=1 Tax=Klebsiella pneumoniae TaxID=573 RepID=UPI0040555756
PVFLVIPFFIKIFALIIILFGIFLGYELSIFYYNIDSYYIVTHKLSSFLGRMWFIPPFRTYFLRGKFLNYSFLITKNLEVGWGELSQ